MMGDVLRGGLLGGVLLAAKGLGPGEIHPVYLALNQLHYDAATVGNHEFNLGLSLLKKSLKRANFPYVNANVYYDDHDESRKRQALLHAISHLPTHFC